MDRRPVKHLTEQEIDEHYSPEQAEAIRAAQRSWPKNYDKSTKSNQIPWSLRYIDPLTEISPESDKPVKQPWSHVDDTARLKTEDEIDEELRKLARSLPTNPADAEKMWLEFDKNFRVTVGSEEANRAFIDALTSFLGGSRS